MTHTPTARAALTAAALSLAAALPAHALYAGQIDSFESGTTLGWGVGASHPLPPTIMSTGGPGGAGDHYMMLQAIGGSSSPGGKLVVRNGAQWAGDYTAAGITALTMDIFNFGPSDLSLRLLFEAGSPALPELAWSTVPVSVPAGSGWQSLVFPISASDLTAAPGGQAAQTLSSAVAIRLFHSTASQFPGEDIVVAVGVDPISAVSEPATAAMLLLGLGLVATASPRRPDRHSC